MNIFTILKERIIDITNKFAAQNIIPSISDTKILLAKISVESPSAEKHGDMSTNVAMIFAKSAKIPPQELAKKYKDELLKYEDIQDIEIAGPGFINIIFKKNFWISQVKNILINQQNYGKNNLGESQKINLEYVSANPTGPLHIGHCRGAIVGDVLANLLTYSGYKITKEYYINDAGGQANELARSAYQRYLEALGEKISENFAYGGSYLIKVGENLAISYGKDFVNQPESHWLPKIREFAIKEMMQLINQDLQALGVFHDKFVSEFSLIKDNKVEESINYLKKLNFIYEGILEKPKSFTEETWHERKQLLFKSTNFGDDVDRALQKSDNSWTYFASDIAYHMDKVNRGYDKLINIWGADHGGYVKRLNAAVQAMTGKTESLKCILCHMVRFIDKGQVLKMSKRAGNYITAKDAVNKVGVDALRFMMVFRKNDAILDFDFEQIVEQSKNNPVFYVQYAYARCFSITRRILSSFPQLKLNQENLINLNIDYTEDEFLPLIRKLTLWSKTVELATIHLEPHRIAYYLHDLVSVFHALWNKGNDNLSLRFIDENSMENTAQNYVLIKALIIILQSGMKILGIKLREEM